MQVIIALVLMYMKMGWTALIGGSVVVMAGPIQYLVGKGMSNMQKKVMVRGEKNHSYNTENHTAKLLKANMLRTNSSLQLSQLYFP